MNINQPGDTRMKRRLRRFSPLRLFVGALASLALTGIAAAAYPRLMSHGVDKPTIDFLGVVAYVGLAATVLLIVASIVRAITR